VFSAGGNPYGTSYPSATTDGAVTQAVLAASAYQGKRLAEFAQRLG
jgi:NAD(P)H dehydrogenase (quinone)